MPYTPTTWVNAGAPAIDETNLNHLETQYAQALADIPEDQAAGTPSERTLGTGAVQAAAGDHEHVLTGDADPADVLDPKTFYKDDTGTRLTGTMPTEAIVAGSDAYAAGYHAGNVGGLDAIDTDLTPANIKPGVTIFGKAGTYVPTLVEDATGTTIGATGAGVSTSNYYIEVGIGAGGFASLAIVTETFASGSRTVGVAFAHGRASASSSLKLQILMDAVVVAESAYIGTSLSDISVVVGTRALSGSVQSIARIHNYAGSARQFRSLGDDPTRHGVVVAVGSIKI